MKPKNKTKPKKNVPNLQDVYYEDVYLNVDWRRTFVLLWYFVSSIICNIIKIYKLIYYKYKRMKGNNLPEGMFERKFFRVAPSGNITPTNKLEKDIKLMYNNINKKFNTINKNK